MSTLEARVPRHPFLTDVVRYDNIQVTREFKGDAFRVVYTVQFGDEIRVLTAFRKKSRQGVKTPKSEVDLIKDRFRRLKEMLQ